MIYKEIEIFAQVSKLESLYKGIQTNEIYDKAYWTVYKAFIEATSSIIGEVVEPGKRDYAYFCSLWVKKNKWLEEIIWANLPK